MSDPAQTNEWKETVRDIFEELHFGQQTFLNNDLARKIIAMIEARHHEYFCSEEGLTRRRI